MWRKVCWFWVIGKWFRPKHLETCSWTCASLGITLLSSVVEIFIIASFIGIVHRIQQWKDPEALLPSQLCSFPSASHLNPPFPYAPAWRNQNCQDQYPTQSSSHPWPSHCPGVFRSRSRHTGAYLPLQTLLPVKVILVFFVGEKMSCKGEQSSLARQGEGTEEETARPSFCRWLLTFLQAVFLTVYSFQIRMECGFRQTWG